MATATSSKGKGNGSPVAAGWSQRELEHLSGIDCRLVKRLAIMLEDWAAQPQASIPEGSRSKAAVKASYRLLSNQRLKAADIGQSHREATWGRMASHEVVLAVADTTSFNHTTHTCTEGVGPIGQSNSSAQGFFLHSVLAFSELGQALGVLHAHTWARERDGPSRRQRQAQKNRKALDQRESHRWISAYEAIAAQRQAASGKLPRVVFVADRESDLYELFVSNLQHDEQCAVLVRALHARRLHETGEVVWDHLEAQEELARVEIVVPAQGTRKERTATLALRSAPVKLGVPRDKAQFFGASTPLDLWAIDAVETSAPEGCEALHWKLLSSIPCADAAQVQRQLRWYARRWGIEVFHRTLKSGCQSEARRLSSLEKLRRALSLDMIVAWRLMALRDASRQQPQEPATQWLEAEECAVLSAWATRQFKTKTQSPPSIAEAVRWIARLGGYLDRKNDPPPGLEVLWRGLRHLHDMSETWKLVHVVGKS